MTSSDDSLISQEVYSADEASAEEENELRRRTVRPQELLECLGDRAGMANVDRGKVERIVHDMSIGSKFYENEQRRSKYLQSQVDRILLKQSRFLSSPPSFRRQARIDSDRQMKGILEEAFGSGVTSSGNSVWNASRCFVHVDLDMFFCAVEMQDDPTLREKPMSVGGAGMLCTANYAARKFGIRAGMPGFIAQQLCKELIVIRPHFDKYVSRSKEFKSVIGLYDPKFHSQGLDEVSLDLSHKAQNMPIDQLGLLVQSIRDHVCAGTEGLTCSAGVGITRILAKINSNVNKPDGQYILIPEDSREKMAKLPVSKVPGIGKRRGRLLEALGLKICEEVWRNADLVMYIFPKISGTDFLRLSAGCEPSAAASKKEGRQSMGCERTFSATKDLVEMINRLRGICINLSKDLDLEELECRRLTLKIKTAEFVSRSIGEQLASPIYRAEDLFRIGLNLFGKHLRQVLPGNDLCTERSLRTLADDFMEGIDDERIEQKKVGQCVDGSAAGGLEERVPRTESSATLSRSDAARRRASPYSIPYSLRLLGITAAVFNPRRATASQESRRIDEFIRRQKRSVSEVEVNELRGEKATVTESFLSGPETAGGAEWWKPRVKKTKKKSAMSGQLPLWKFASKKPKVPSKEEIAIIEIVSDEDNVD